MRSHGTTIEDVYGEELGTSFRQGQSVALTVLIVQNLALTFLIGKNLALTVLRTVSTV